MKEIKQWDLVIVEWLDADLESGWGEESPTLEHELLAQTVGFLISQNDLCTTIAQSRDTQGDTNGRMRIPTKMVKSIKRLEIKRQFL